MQPVVVDPTEQRDLVHVSARIPRRQRDLLEALACRLLVPRAFVIRQALALFLAQHAGGRGRA